MGDEIKKVIVTGVTSQGGSLMVDFLLKNTPHLIYGGVRRLAMPNYKHLEHLDNEPRFQLITLDLNDVYSVEKAIQSVRPDYFANFAAISFVDMSWDTPHQVMDTNVIAVLGILESIRKYAPSCRFINIGSSEEFGGLKYTPQDENHPLCPNSLYGVSKASARHVVQSYRKKYNLYAVQSWCYNYESVRRGDGFVTRKISKGVARIANAIKKNLPWKPLELGNFYISRDWSHANDVVDAVWRMLNQREYRLEWRRGDQPKDYVVSSGVSHRVLDFIEKAFSVVDVGGKVEVGADFDNKYFSEVSDVPLVITKREFVRPPEAVALCGNSGAIRSELGWNPKISFDEIVREMVLYDLMLDKQENSGIV